MNPALLSKIYHASHRVIDLFSEKSQVKLASFGRLQFMKNFAEYSPEFSYVPPEYLSVSAWGLNFRSSLMNSAGMFKNGEGYDTVAKLGAGGYIGGTSTVNPRIGNAKNGVTLPFITFPKSKVAINWLGLPNLGDDVLSEKIISTNKVADCPIGWSVMRSPDFPEADGLQLLIRSLWKYHNNLQIDFLEINESCPNIKNGGGSIFPRLKIISQEFIAKKERRLPVIIKLSNDITIESLSQLLPEIISLGFDGINLGNTSTAYKVIRPQICDNDKMLFDYFTCEFGGGISGAVLKQKSLELCAVSAEIIEKLKPDHEFHIIRSGGISSSDDIKESIAHGVTLNQWYTGFFECFNNYSDKVYQKIYNDV